MNPSIFLVIAALLIGQVASAQQPDPLNNSANLVFGVGQIIQGGFNVEGNVFYQRITFDYSHGINLNTSNDQLEDGADKDQGLAIHLP